MRSRVGGGKEKAQAEPNERIVESFGSTANPKPFLVVDKAINNAKSKIMKQKDPPEIGRIRAVARLAVEQDTQQALDERFSLVQIVSKPLEDPSLGED